MEDQSSDDSKILLVGDSPMQSLNSAMALSFLQVC